MAKDWLIEAKYIEYCSCDLGCPCESMADPTFGHCTGLVGFKIDKGYCDDVKLDGLSVVATFFFPRAIHHGGGVMNPIIDERANDDQKAALFYIMSGEDQAVGMRSVITRRHGVVRDTTALGLGRFLGERAQVDTGADDGTGTCVGA